MNYWLIGVGVFLLISVLGLLLALFLLSFVKKNSKK